MKKLKLKEDADGNKITKERGIRAACKIMKTRHTKPFESVQIHIPYDTGMDPYSGLFDMFLEKEVLIKTGNSYIYTSSVDGTEIKKFKKGWNKNEDGCLDRLMKEFDLTKQATDPIIVDETNIEIQEEA